MAGSHDGWLVVGGAAGQITTFDVRHRQLGESITWSANGSIRALTFTRDGSAFAGADSNGTIHVWTTSDRRMRTTLQNGEEVSALAFDATGEYLAAGSSAGNVTVWDLDTLLPTARFSHGTAVGSVGFASAGVSLLLYGGSGGFVFQPWRWPPTSRATPAVIFPGRH